jgi:hypothetical protein
MSEHEKKLLDAFQDTKDGLIKITDLEKCKEVNSERILFKLKTNNKDYNQPLLYPSHRALSVINYLVNDSMLSNLSSIRVSTDDIGMLSVPMFGVNFESAIKIVTREKFVKSIFYIPQQDNSSGFIEEKGFACYLVVHLGANKENGEMKFHLEAWHGNEVDPTVYYIHSIFSKPFDLQQIDQAFIEHLDGAVIEYTQLDKEDLFLRGNENKDLPYQKQFRIDGKISLHILYEIAKIYFPIDSLTEEYFGLNGITSDNNMQRYRVSANDS